MKIAIGIAAINEYGRSRMVNFGAIAAGSGCEPHVRPASVRVLLCPGPEPQFPAPSPVPGAAAAIDLSHPRQ